MDRDRLKEVHQTDLTEGRINQDFVDWLQTKGVSWLLMVLVALVAYMGIIRWKNHRTNYQTEAWVELTKAAVPSSYEEVADKYTDVGAVPELARLRAAQALLTAVQTGKAIGSDAAAQKDLTDDERSQYLDRADRLYAKVIEVDDQSQQKALLVITALTGRAAVAESKGQLDQAKQYYTQAAQRAETMFPKLAEQARSRASSAEEQSKPLPMMSRQALSQAQQHPTEPAKPLDPVSLENWAKDLLMPSDTGG